METLERLLKKSTAAVYALFGAEPKAHYLNNRPCITFKCLKCKNELNRFLDTGDRSSTSNLSKHGNKCWGKEVMKNLGNPGADGTDALRLAAKGFLKDGDITRFLTSSAAESTARHAVTYSHKALTKMQTR